MRCFYSNLIFLVAPAEAEQAGLYVGWSWLQYHLDIDTIKNSSYSSLLMEVIPSYPDNRLLGKFKQFPFRPFSGSIIITDLFPELVYNVRIYANRFSRGLGNVELLNTMIKTGKLTQSRDVRITHVY